KNRSSTGTRGPASGFPSRSPWKPSNPKTLGPRPSPEGPPGARRIEPRLQGCWLTCGLPNDGLVRPSVIEWQDAITGIEVKVGTHVPSRESASFWPHALKHTCLLKMLREEAGKIGGGRKLVFRMGKLPLS